METSRTQSALPVLNPAQPNNEASRSAVYDDREAYDVKQANVNISKKPLGVFMKTPLSDMLGIEYPIIAVPMGPDLTGPELVAAVSNAGGLGILQAQFCLPPVFRHEIDRVRELTAKPFGVNLLLHFPVGA
jgi:hypothetical protein